MIWIGPQKIWLSKLLLKLQILQKSNLSLSSLKNNLLLLKILLNHQKILPKPRYRPKSRRIRSKRTRKMQRLRNLPTNLLLLKMRPRKWMPNQHQAHQQQTQLWQKLKQNLLRKRNKKPILSYKKKIKVTTLRPKQLIIKKLRRNKFQLLAKN